MGDYRKLQVWERAHQLTLGVYEDTRALPKDELFGLTGPLRRSASSIPANLAEGCGRNSDAELARFSAIAMGSANEIDDHLLLARDLGYLSSEQYDRLASESQGVSRMRSSLIGRPHPAKSQGLIADSR